MIRVDGLRLHVGTFSLAMDLDVRAGEYLVLLGPSGSGKTLLLESICGLLTPQSGRVSVGDVDVTSLPPRERGIGYVPQDGALFEHLRVDANIGFGLAVAHMPVEERSKRVREVAQMLGVEHLLHRRIRGLSGGERQRVALGRALAVRPRVLLLDEPVSALDEPTRESICLQLKQLHRSLGLTVLHVCHSLEEARLVSDRVGIAAHGEVIQCGTLRELEERPRDMTVARMLRLVNVFAGRGASNGTVEIGGVPLKGPSCSGDVHLYVRPWALQIAADAVPATAANVVRATVSECERSGPLVELTLGGPIPLVCYLSHREAAAMKAEAGQAISVSFAPKDVVVLGES